MEKFEAMPDRPRGLTSLPVHRNLILLLQAEQMGKGGKKIVKDTQHEYPTQSSTSFEWEVV